MLGLNRRGISESFRTFRGALMSTLMTMGLWDGKQFRQYRAFSAATQLRFVAATDFILTGQTLYCDNGLAQVRVLTGATPAGTWADTPTQQAKNRLGTVTYVQQNKMQAGGTFTGGTERELFRSDSGGGQGVSFSNVDGNPRVLPAGTYYFDITVTGTTDGIYSFEWEELGTVNGV